MLLALCYLSLLQPKLNRAETTHPQADLLIVVVVDTDVGGFSQRRNAAELFQREVFRFERAEKLSAIVDAEIINDIGKP